MSSSEKRHAQQFLRIQPLTGQVKPVLNSQRIQVKGKNTPSCGEYQYCISFCYKVKSGRVFILVNASVLTLGSEITLISDFFCVNKTKQKTLCIILFHTMQAIGTKLCVCRTDSWLARKADTWYKWLYKKVMFQKHTGTAILLKMTATLL